METLTGELQPAKSNRALRNNNGGRRICEATRERIKTGKVITRLQQHVFGKIEMTATQIRAAEILLRKTLPDLQSVSLDDGSGGPAVLRILWGRATEIEDGEIVAEERAIPDDAEGPQE